LCDEGITRWVKKAVVTVAVAVAVVVAVAEQLFCRVADSHACSAFRNFPMPGASKMSGHDGEDAYGQTVTSTATTTLRRPARRET